MCGIVGILSKNQNVVGRLLSGLKRLEYRGYDSSGIASIDNNILDRRRAAGKIINLEKHLNESPLEGFIGIGHTRWATHGKADVYNAHPHGSDKIAVVHNGIIENFASLRNMLKTKNYRFESETDTEVVVHLLADYISQGLDPLDAFKKMIFKLQGAFALAIILKDHPTTMLIARSGSPLVIGFGYDEMYIGSDALALAPWTDTLSYLEEGDVGVISLINDEFSVDLFDKNDLSVTRPTHKTSINPEAINKGNFDHYMLKEIHEQPKSMGDTIQSLIDIETLTPRENITQLEWAKYKRIALIACGTSYYACQVAKYWFESIARLSVDVDIASEFRYRHPIIDQYDLVIVVSQSGETIDTLWVLKQIKEQGVPIAAIVNVDESSIARAADYTILTQAGPEIGVASTKAFTCQLLVFAAMALWASHKRGHLSRDEWNHKINNFMEAPSHMLEALTLTDSIQDIAKKLVDCADVLYLGRGTNFPLALEGALKLKELSYIHAEAYPAGELKHGPIALIDHKIPVVVLIPYDEWFEKTLSNVQEVIARGAYVIAITDHEGMKHFKRQEMKNVDFIVMNHESEFLLNPLVYSIPMQLLAYYTAYFKGTDVDQPRNLAKSVTVE